MICSDYRLRKQEEAKMTFCIDNCASKLLKLAGIFLFAVGSVYSLWVLSFYANEAAQQARIQREALFTEHFEAGVKKLEQNNNFGNKFEDILNAYLRANDSIKDFRSALEYADTNEQEEKVWKHIVLAENDVKSITKIGQQYLRIRSQKALSAHADFVGEFLQDFESFEKIIDSK